MDELRHRHAALQPRRVPLALRDAAHPVGAALQPARDGRHPARSRLQHLGQLRHQHELAELRRREHHELSGANVRPHLPQLRLGRDRHSVSTRADPRLRAPLGEDPRQLLGRSRPLRALRPDADLDRRGTRHGVAGHAAEPRTLCRGDHARRCEAGDRSRAGRLPGRDQDAGHERRRLLQFQCRASL